MLVPAALSPDLLTRLAGLSGAKPSPVAPVTPSGGRVTPFSAAGVTDICAPDQLLSAAVTPVTPVTPSETAQDVREERAAILEFEGGWLRHLAEEIASHLVELLNREVSSEEWAAFDAYTTALGVRQAKGSQ